MSRSNRFAFIPVNVQEHFRLALLGVVLDMLDRERRDGQLEEFLDHFGFLKSYGDRIEALWGAEKLPRPHDWEQAVATWHQAHTSLPLTNLARIAPDPIAITATVLVSAIEEDPRFALLVEAEGGAPTLGGMTALLSDLFPQESTGAIREQLFDLVTKGFCVLGQQEHPRVEWTLRMSRAGFEVLTGSVCERDQLKIISQAALPNADGWIAPHAASENPQAHAQRLSELSASTTLIRGDGHNGRKTFARMAAGEAAFPVVQVSGAAITQSDLWLEANLVAGLHGALLIVECAPAPGERVTIPPAPVEAPHLALVTTHSASIDHARPSAAFFAIDMPRPDQQARIAHWRAAGWANEAKGLSERVLTSGHIHRIAKGSERKTRKEAQAAIEATLQSLRDPRLEATAQRVELDASLDTLVLDNDDREELDNLALRCRLREQLHTSSEAGVKALLSGPSGSGKTLAAKHLARELGRPLYRIDLSATVNKYIGETEKNLEQALAAAEELDIVLLLDEGDALLAKRTDVSSSTDRYANMETNFLLQRLEAFRGIIVVTTNDAERIDGAFRRRMDAILPFRLPDQLRRQEILSLQLGEHAVSQQLIDEIACKCNFSGGQLRNIVLHARLLALSEVRPISDAHLLKSVEREYRKSSEHCPLRPALAKVG